MLSEEAAIPVASRSHDGCYAPTSGGRASLWPVVDRQRDGRRQTMDDHSFPTSFPIAVRNAQAPIVDRLSDNQLIPTTDGSESRPYRSPFAMPRHLSSIVNRLSSCDPIP